MANARICAKFGLQHNGPGRALVSCSPERPPFSNGGDWAASPCGCEETAPGSSIETARVFGDRGSTACFAANSFLATCAAVHESQEHPVPIRCNDPSPSLIFIKILKA